MKKAGFSCILLPLSLVVLPCTPVFSQMITGTWKGKINRQKVEVKIIQRGDSLTGTSYYYESASNYRRYTIKGYFDQNTNEAVWWDDRLLEEKSGRFSLTTPGKIALLSRADFNCPGGGRMMLDGKVYRKEDQDGIKGDVHLDKTNDPQFGDEWDFVIDNFLAGANDPDIIDSVAALSLAPVKIAPVTPPVANEEKPMPRPAPTREPVAITTPPVPVAEEKPAVKAVTPPEKKPAPVPPSPPLVQAPPPVKPPDIVEKFQVRQKVFVKEIPVTGDSIELRFYDNAEIDGDSISVFLNDKLLFSHIRLTGNAYTVKLSVADLLSQNELTMVAENLGAIPPNTSYMVAMVNGVKYDAYLSSTEGSSAMIKLTKKIP
ncbi:MAG: hypothetical protein NTW29_11135 [Bacteroidetes bacterium]|nr:hypothetical protein [Bacteroidota bacterium]